MTYYTGRDLASAFRTVRKNTIQIANDIPDNKYGFRATAETKTVAELLAHIAAATTWVHKLHAVDKRTQMNFEIFGSYMQELAGVEGALTNKTVILQALQKNGDAFAAWLESLTDATLAETVSFPPPIEPSRKTRFEMLLGSKEHEMHHRAQLMVMERLLGITPHLTQQREAMRAAATAKA